MFAALFILFMISIVIFGSIFVVMTLRHHKRVDAQEKLVKPPENK